MIPCSLIPYPQLKILSGILIQSSYLITIFWSTCISVTIYYVVILSGSNFERHHIKWILICYILIPGCMTLPLITNSYGSTSNICGLDDDLGIIWKILIIYGPVFLCVFIASLTWLRIYFKVKNGSFNRFQKTLIRRLSLFLLFIFLDIIPDIILTIAQLFLDECVEENLGFLSYGIFGLHGFFNLILFGIGNYMKLTNIGHSVHQYLYSYNTSSFFSSNLLLEESSAVNKIMNNLET